MTVIRITQLKEALCGYAQANKLFLMLVVAHFAITVAVASYAGLAYSNSAVNMLFVLFGTLIPAYLFGLLVARFIYMAIVIRPARPASWLVADIRAKVFDLNRLVTGLATLTVLSLFFSNFSFLKEAIPMLNPYAWDEVMMQVDRTLHGGFDVYQILMPFFGGPMLLTVLGGAYVIWLFLLYFMTFIAAFTKLNPQARSAFLVAFVLTWGIGGNLIATVFSSVGPVYYAPMGLGDVYEPLMQHLRALGEMMKVPSLLVQNMLWEGYTSGKTVAGISAFPSMHVASSTLLACYAFSFHRYAGWLISAFTGIIMVASVMLGWHYAVDGYAGFALALISWKTAMWLCRPKQAAQVGIPVAS
jgi:membrane-associated phospholipid phosphatase